MDGPGIESRWGGKIFRTYPDRPWGPPSLLYNGYRVFPEGKERPGRDADPSPLLVPRSRKGRAIPLLPLWAVRPVQSLSVCTRVHFTLPFNAPCKVTQCCLPTDPSVCLVTALYNVTESSVDVVIIPQRLLFSTHLVVSTFQSLPGNLHTTRFNT